MVRCIIILSYHNDNIYYILYSNIAIFIVHYARAFYIIFIIIIVMAASCVLLPHLPRPCEIPGIGIPHIALSRNNMIRILYYNINVAKPKKKKKKKTLITMIVIIILKYNEPPRMCRAAVGSCVF